MSDKGEASHLFFHVVFYPSLFLDLKSFFQLVHFQLQIKKTPPLFKWLRDPFVYGISWAEWNATIFLMRCVAIHWFSFTDCVWDGIITRKSVSSQTLAWDWIKNCNTARRQGQTLKRFFKEPTATFESLLSTTVRKTFVMLRFVPTNHSRWKTAVSVNTNGLELCML